MDTLQRRPLSGLSGGIVFVTTAGALTVHTLNATASTSGGPFIQEVTLWVMNGANATRTLTVTVNGVSTAAITLPANTLPFKVFDGQPFLASGATIQLQASADATSISAWGWFTSTA